MHKWYRPNLELLDETREYFNQVLRERSFDSIKGDAMTKSQMSEYVTLEMINSYSKPGEFKTKIMPALEAIRSVEPQDAVEAMLATQMFLVNDAIFSNHRTSINSGSELRNSSINNMNKLARTYASQMEALKKYRGNYNQKITVEHLNVNDGGKGRIKDSNATDLIFNLIIIFFSIFNWC